MKDTRRSFCEINMMIHAILGRGEKNHPVFNGDYTKPLPSLPIPSMYDIFLPTWPLMQVNISVPWMVWVLNGFKESRIPMKQEFFHSDAACRDESHQVGGWRSCSMHKKTKKDRWDWYIYVHDWLIFNDFHGKNVGKCTVRPMDPIWYMTVWNGFISQILINCLASICYTITTDNNNTKNEKTTTNSKTTTSTSTPTTLLCHLKNRLVPRP